MSTAARLSSIMGCCLIAGFVAGWSARTLPGSPDGQRVGEAVEIDSEGAAALPESPDIDEAGAVIDRKPRPPGYVENVNWEDRFQPVVVSRRPLMTTEGAYTVGTQEVDSYDEVEVTVSSAREPDGTFVVGVHEGDAWAGILTRLRLDPRTQLIEGSVQSAGVSLPRPPLDWADVGGEVAVSSLEWTAGRSIVLDYSLHGMHGGHRICSHGKVWVQL